jgi:hypothetical protein
VRDEPEGEVAAVLVLGTLGAPQPRRRRGRRGRSLEEAKPAAVPASRATVVHAEPFPSRDEAERWLGAVRGDEGVREDELDRALGVLNRAVHAHRVSAPDAALGDLSLARATVTRIGFGAGDEVAQGRFGAAWELPRGRSKTKRSMEAPEERFAAIVSGRETALPAEELVLRARADIDAGRPREAALQARVALESLLAELPADAPRRADLEADRTAVGQAANAALAGTLDEELARGLESALFRMERALARHRVESP